MFETRTISETFHVGNLDGKRNSTIKSHEGRGVSISPVPNAWRQIDGCVHGDTYQLRHPTGGTFLDYTLCPTEVDQAIREYCIEAGYTIPATAYEVRYKDGRGNERFFYKQYRNDAERAAKEESYHASTVSEISSVSLGPKGRTYWTDAFESKPESPPVLFIEDLSILWFAEAAGYDGVYWDNELNIGEYSAPKGVIFQSTFGEWEIADRRSH